MSRRSVDDWRATVLSANKVSPAARLYLLYLADHMNANRRVSRPRHLIAKDLRVSERTVDYRNTAAVKAGLLTVLKNGQKHVTAEYVGTFPEALSAQGGFALRNDENLRAEKSPLSVNHDLSAQEVAHQYYSGPVPATDHRDVGIDEKGAAAPVVDALRRGATEDREATA